MFGYQEGLDSLPVSETLQKRLEAIRPRPTEMYVLAHVHGDDIKEYAEWERHNENYHAGLWPMPFMIRGDPFKITAREKGTSQHCYENRMNDALPGLPTQATRTFQKHKAPMVLRLAVALDSFARPAKQDDLRAEGYQEARL